MLGNYIGTDMNGTSALGNTYDGILIMGDNNYIGGYINRKGNIISGNGSYGIRIYDSDSNYVRMNYIGTDVTGTASISNGDINIVIYGGSDYNRIGSTNSTYGNIIAYSPAQGVYLGTNSNRNSIYGNTIHSNGNRGITIASSCTRIWICQNSIYSNNGLGIDLGYDGIPNPNDLGDGDTGANNLQNYPVISSVLLGSSTVINWSLNSSASTDFTIEFFYSSSLDPSGYGEGETYLGSVSTTTDGSGNASGTDTFSTTVPNGYYITATATDSFLNTSEFSAGVVTPTMAVVSDFRTYYQNGNPVIHWETAFESNTVGFNLFKLDKHLNKYIQLNNNLLPGLLHSTQGGIYRFIDPGVSPNSLYKLEEIEASGRRRTYGPFDVKTGMKTYDRILEPIRSKYHRTARPASPEKIRRIQDMRLSKETNQSIIRNQTGTAIKIGVIQNGIYYLDASDIANLMGISQQEVVSMTNDHQLNLTCGGNDIPWHKDTNASGIYFYGEMVESLYSTENIYWLKQEQGKIMEPGAFIKTLPSPFKNTFTETIHIEQDKSPATGLFNDPDADYWLWESIISSHPELGTKRFNVKLDGVAPVSKHAFLTVNLYSVTDTTSPKDHNVKVKLNGRHIGSGTWDGVSSKKLKLSFNQYLLKNGINTIDVSGVLGSGVSYSVFCVDSFDLTYERKGEAANNRLFVRGSDNNIISVSGFTSPEIMVFEVTDPVNPKVIRSATVDRDVSSYRVSFVPSSPDASYITLTKSALMRPSSVVADTSSNLRKRGSGAEYVVITPEELKAASEYLASYRSSRGLSSMVVGVEDIYDEFNHGIPSPVAIREFLNFAYKNWWHKPRYVVLVGKGTFDYRNILGYGDNLIPTLMVSTPNGLFASDSIYGDVIGDDGVPEVAVGRIPVMTSEELNSIINKIRAYERNRSGNTAVMIVDNPDQGGNYTEDSNDLSELLKTTHNVSKIYLSQHNVNEARSLLLNRLKSGANYVNYIGHAGINCLAHEGLLRCEDVCVLSNSNKLPVLTLLTCAAGNFSIPGYDSLTELLLLKRGGGVVAVWSPTGTSLNSYSKVLGEGFFQAVFLGEWRIRLGDAVLNAMRGYSTQNFDRYILAIYNILGDPALELKRSY